MKHMPSRHADKTWMHRVPRIHSILTFGGLCLVVTWQADLLPWLDHALLVEVSLLGSRFGSSGPGSSQKDCQGQKQARKQQHHTNSQQGVEQDSGVFQG